MINWFKNLKNENDNNMTLTVKNYVLLLVGAIIIILGFVLMSGGEPSTPETFDYSIFSFRRITLAPIVVVAGFAFEIYAILKRF